VNVCKPETGRSVQARQLALSAISGPSALPPNFLQSGHASSSINGQPYSGAKGEPLRRGGADLILDSGADAHG